MNKIQNICSSLLKLLPGTEWELDERFNTLLIVCTTEELEEVKDSIFSLFKTAYDSTTIRKASKDEKKITKFFMGISPGQYLLCETGEDHILYVAWWPWGDNLKTTLRIGIYSLIHKENNRTEDIQQLKTLLKI